MNSSILILVFILAIVLAVAGLIYWYYFHPPHRMHRKLKNTASVVLLRSGDNLKNSYLDIYNLYLRLSEKHKSNFYTKITKLREKIEEQMKAEKRIQELIPKSNFGGVEERKAVYLEMHQNYQKLPKEVQHKYYPDIVNLREQLERGN